MSKINNPPINETLGDKPVSPVWRGWFQSLVNYMNEPLPVFADNAAAIAGGRVAGDRYRTGADPDVVCVVH